MAVTVGGDPLISILSELWSNEKCRPKHLLGVLLNKPSVLVLQLGDQQLVRSLFFFIGANSVVCFRLLLSRECEDVVDV